MAHIYVAGPSNIGLADRLSQRTRGEHTFYCAAKSEFANFTDQYAQLVHSKIAIFNFRHEQIGEANEVGIPDAVQMLLLLGMAHQACIDCYVLITQGDPMLYSSYFDGISTMCSSEQELLQKLL